VHCVTGVFNQITENLNRLSFRIDNAAFIVSNNLTDIHSASGCRQSVLDDNISGASSIAWLGLRKFQQFARMNHRSRPVRLCSRYSLVFRIPLFQTALPDSGIAIPSIGLFNSCHFASHFAHGDESLGL
jgi:hypothetical protein